ncbi:MAG: ABC transporter permease [Pseudomonadales bacterium]
MLALIVRRLLLSVVTLMIVSVVVFAVTELLPGDWATAYFGREATPERLERLRAELGLDRPATERFANWFVRAVQGDLGSSLSRKEPVAGVIAFRLRNSLLLGGVAGLVAIPLALALGVIAGLTRGRRADVSISTISLIGMSLPEFVVGTVLIFAFSIRMSIFPALTIVRADTSFVDFLPNIVLPAATLTIVWVAYILRMVRTTMIDVLASEYVEMATLKGIPRARVVLRHALPNALLPTINVIALMLAALLGGVVVIETVFNYPGVGRLLVTAIKARDVPLIQGIAITVAVMYVTINLIADLLTTSLDPRLRSLRG